jgi:carbon storage regulator
MHEGALDWTDGPARPTLDRTPARVVAARGPSASDPRRMGGLVLTRHRDQSIVIADEVEVRVVSLKADSVRLRITAPRSIPVHRREVYDAIRSASSRSTPEGRDTAGRSPSGQGPGGLVLSRHRLESVMIGDDVEVVVAEVRPSAVRLRITAPRDVTVHRREIQEAIRRGESGPSEVAPGSPGPSIRGPGAL